MLQIAGYYRSEQRIILLGSENVEKGAFFLAYNASVVLFLPGLVARNCVE
jgi:hypothetical protein